MALTLVKETGTGLANANSYADRSDGDAYHESHLYATIWDAATQERKEIALVMATRLVDDIVTWKGTKAAEVNALDWPRHAVTLEDGNFVVDDNVIPLPLIHATAEMARLLLATDRTADAGTDGFSKMKAGSLELVVDNTTKPENEIVTDSVWLLIADYALERASRGGTIATLVRT